ncbi:hypothetical protein MKK88_14250 [Methylobacterium sp. E-005]|nr:hypothetical protein [Methylobacterium sp. E-005]
MGARDANSAFNQHQFQQRQIFGEKRFHFTGEIVAVHNRNSLTEPCTVDVKPHVKQMDGAGNTTSHDIIYGIAVPRSQSGGSVFINDPQVGDPANFSVLDRDHSSVQANDWVESNPGSYRRHSMSDAIFHGVLPRKSQPVTQHFMFTDTGIDCADMNKNTFNSSSAGWNFNGAIIDQKGNFTAPGNVTAGKGSADQVDLQGHSHSGNGAAPTAGS